MLAELKNDPVMYQRLLVGSEPQLAADRSRRSSPATAHAFVVVGAAHLVGPDGLLAMLRAKGYTVEQM